MSLRVLALDRRDFFDNPDVRAAAIGVSRQSVKELLRGRRAVSPEMALRLGRLFGNSPAFWRSAQRAVDLWDAVEEIKDDVAGIKTLSVS